MFFEGGWKSVAAFGYRVGGGRGLAAWAALARRVMERRYPAAKTKAMVLAAEAEIAHSDSDEAPPCRHRGRGSAAARGAQDAPTAAGGSGAGAAQAVS